MFPAKVSYPLSAFQYCSASMPSRFPRPAFSFQPLYLSSCLLPFLPPVMFMSMILFLILSLLLIYQRINYMSKCQLLGRYTSDSLSYRIQLSGDFRPPLQEWVALYSQGPAAEAALAPAA